MAMISKVIAGSEERWPQKETVMSEPKVRMLNIARVVAETVREVGEAPSGPIYAALMGVVSLSEYEAVVSMLVRAKVIAKRGHLLVWNRKAA